LEWHNLDDKLPVGGAAPARNMEWQGSCYVEAGIIIRGGVARDNESLPWTAVRMDMDLGQVAIGDFPTVEEAKAAVEAACGPLGTTL
jgi:hypothetical protein